MMRGDILCVPGFLARDEDELRMDGRIRFPVEDVITLGADLRLTVRTGIDVDVEGAVEALVYGAGPAIPAQQGTEWSQVGSKGAANSPGSRCQADVPRKETGPARCLPWGRLTRLSTGMKRRRRA